MKEKQTQMWIPLYVDKWIFGSTRIELDPSERSVFIDLLVFGAKDQGYIRANETTAYPHTQLAGLLNIPVELLQSTIVKCLHFEKIIELIPGIYRLKNWEEYQLSYDYKYRIETGRKSIPGNKVRENSDSSPKNSDSSPKNSDSSPKNSDSSPKNSAKVGPIREDKIREEKRREEKKVHIDPEPKKETAIQYIIRAYKVAIGIPENDKEFDKKWFPRLAKSASEIIAAFQGDQKYATWWANTEIYKWNDWAKKNDKSFSLERIALESLKAKGKYLELKSQEEKDERNNRKEMGACNPNQRRTTSGLTPVGKIAASAIHRLKESEHINLDKPTGGGSH